MHSNEAQLITSAPISYRSSSVPQGDIIGPCNECPLENRKLCLTSYRLNVNATTGLSISRRDKPISCVTQIESGTTGRPLRSAEVVGSPSPVPAGSNLLKLLRADAWIIPERSSYRSHTSRFLFIRRGWARRILVNRRRRVGDGHSPTCSTFSTQPASSSLRPRQKAMLRWSSGGARASDEYMHMSLSSRGNDQYTTRRCTGSGMRS